MKVTHLNSATKIIEIDGVKILMIPGLFVFLIHGMDIQSLKNYHTYLMTLILFIYLIYMKIIFQKNIKKIQFRYRIYNSRIF